MRLCPESGIPVVACEQTSMCECNDVDAAAVHAEHQHTCPFVGEKVRAMCAATCGFAFCTGKPDQWQGWVNATPTMPVEEDPGPFGRSYVCDGCMSRVTPREVAVWADYEHVVCRNCDAAYRQGTVKRHLTLESLAADACSHYLPDGYCGVRERTDRFLVGWRCPVHTPAALAGRREVVPDPELTLEGLRRKR